MKNFHLCIFSLKTLKTWTFMCLYSFFWCTVKLLENPINLFYVWFDFWNYCWSINQKESWQESQQTPAMASHHIFTFYSQLVMRWISEVDRPQPRFLTTVLLSYRILPASSTGFRIPCFGSVGSGFILTTNFPIQRYQWIFSDYSYDKKTFYSQLVMSWISGLPGYPKSTDPSHGFSPHFYFLIEFSLN